MRLADDVADLLRERLIQGRYAPGALLSRRRLAEELSVSPTVVGEALRMLERDGVVTIAPPGRGIRVPADNGSTLLAAYTLREVIDGLAARLAARHAGPALEPALLAALAEQRAAVERDDTRRFARANVAFHGAVIDGSGNPLLRGQLTLVRGTARGVTLLGQARMREAIAEHGAILRAVAARRPGEAERAARKHVRTTMAALQDYFDVRREAADDR